MTEATKYCTRCKNEKSLLEFGIEVARPDGHACACKKCLAEIAVERRHRFKVGEPKKSKRVEHKILEGVEVKYCSRCKNWVPLSLFSISRCTWDKLATFCKSCYIENTKKYEIENPEKVKECSRRFRENMSEEQKQRRLESSRKYVESLSKEEKHNIYLRCRSKQKQKYEAMFFINNAISEGIRQSLLLCFETKNLRHWEECVGYTLQELIKHLEFLFKEDMSWENYGRSCKNERYWEIDHKIPKTWFKFKSLDDEGFKKCWVLANLQPKWSTENQSKGNRYSD